MSYVPNFILVGGIANKVKQSEKDFIAEQQIKGNFDSIADLLMKQYNDLGEHHHARKTTTRYQTSSSVV